MGQRNSLTHSIVFYSPFILFSSPNISFKHAQLLFSPTVTLKLYTKTILFKTSISYFVFSITTLLCFYPSVPHWDEVENKGRVLSMETEAQRTQWFIKAIESLDMFFLNSWDLMAFCWKMKIMLETKGVF